MMDKYGEQLKISVLILDEDTKKYTSNFSCGNPSIDNYFRKEAADDNTSVTYLYIDTEADSLIACITISCSAIFTTDEEQRSYSTLLSAMEVKYLATDESYQHLQYFKDKPKRSLSDMLFDYMITCMAEISHKEIGAAKIVLYAVPQAINFYRRHGFVEFGDTMYGDEGDYLDGCEPMYFDLNN